MAGGDISKEIDDNHVTVIFKDYYDLCLAAKTGNRDAFSGILNQVSAAEHASSDDILHRLGPARNTILHIAAKFGKEDIVTILHIAAKFGKEDIVTYICEKDPSLLLCENSGGETALHLAAKRGHLLMVKNLVEIHKFAVEFQKLAHVFSSCEAEENHEHGLSLSEAEENNARGLGVRGAKARRNKARDLGVKGAKARRNKQRKLKIKKGYSSEAEENNARGLNSSFSSSSASEAEKNNAHGLNSSYSSSSASEAEENNARGLNSSYSSSSASEAEDKKLLRARNEKGNTALHEALINGRESIAEYLIQEDPEASCYTNKYDESTLFLAAKVGYAKCVAMILRSSTDQEQINKQFKKRLPFQAAVIGKHRGVLEEILKANLGSTDALGRTPLHYAASFGYLDEVRYLLSKYPSSATQRDFWDSLPIHLASENGHVDIIKVLLNYFPDAELLLDKSGRNILHLAASKGRYNVVKYILNNPNLSDLTNMKDKYGNTPLHLAASQWHLKIVFDLTWDKEVDATLADDEGLTALDLAEKCDESDDPKFRQRLTCAALKAAGVPNGVPRLDPHATEKTAKHHPVMGKYKERLNTFLLMSILVATITFAAGFTLPGGYNSSSDTDLGIATMLREKGFNVFVFCDTMAMYSSIIVAVALIWAQLGDTALVYNALTLTAPLLGFALGMMSMAFTAGVFLAVSKLRWLSIAVLVMGITFTAILSVLLIPLCVPLASSNRILRYISYYPFCLVILANNRLAKGPARELPMATDMPELVALARIAFLGR